MRTSVLSIHRSVTLALALLGTTLLLGAIALAQQPAASEPLPDAEAAGVAPEPAMESVEEQRSFRGNSGLRSDEEYVRGLGSDPARRAADDVETWGIPLTPDELADLDRRVAIGAATPIIKEYAAAEMPPELFAGLWQDNLQGGRIVVALTRPAPDHEQAIRALFPFPDDLAFVVREVRLEQLSDVYDRAVALMGPPGLPLGDGLVNDVVVDEIVGTVVLTVPLDVPIAEIRSLFPESFVQIVQGEHKAGIRE